MPSIRSSLALLAAVVLLAAAPAAAAPWPWQHLSDDPSAHPHAAGGDAGSADDDGGGDGKEKEEAWSVAEPPLDTYEATVDVTEGTWMNLDVSPDGETIVFDLLGDIYLLPIGGGEAEAISSGLPWDMQPRFSPDGEHIAFTSDEGGGDNVWIMRRDGSERTQVTKEDFRLLNNAVWTPDGEYLAARKHFTSRRSLGAGEIWLYHRSGGSGLQMTERPNDQKDLGEPAFSPDGRYLYFSQDATPGPVFEYNKDPNGQIYVIKRLDRESGEIETFIDGAGGAVRPTPSPDGRSLAFVRRVSYKTSLFVHDLASGENRLLYDGLDRDHQETWAVHGVYANFAWTPDSRAIVFWAGGKLHRIDVAGGELAEIPFHVRQTHRMIEALHVEHDPAPASFDARMLRWVEVSPQGDRVLFQALGYVWVKDLDGGAPRRLTTQEEHFEYYPSFSRDGRQVVYVSWDDDRLGAVRVAPAGGGEGRVLTAQPGHYLEPVFSPDGETVVFRKSAGGFLSKPLYGRDLGLYKVPASGGEAERIADHGVSPHFGASSERVFFVDFEPEDRRALRSIGLDGKDERTHVTSEAATELVVSPDGKWLAFAERFHAYVAPFVATGKAIAIGPKTTSIPVKQVSAEAGNYLHWSGDAETLHWSLGNELFSRSLSRTFAFLEGAPEALPEPESEGREIRLTAASDVPSGTVALVGARLITMRGDEVIEDGTVVVEGNRIRAVGAREAVAVPEGAHVVDLAGHTIIPGIVDVHWHGSQGFSEIVPQRDWFNYATLAFGVTTIHDPSNDTSTFFAASEMARTGAIVAPRLFSTGTILYGAAGDFKAIINSLEDARFHLRRMKAAGAFSVKSYNQPRRDQRQQVIAAARELGMLVMPEGGSLFMHNMTMVVDGHTGIEHAVPLARLYDDVLQLWSQSRTAYTPTLVVGYGGIWGENYWYATTDVWKNERLLTFVPREFVEPRARRPFKAPLEEYNHFRIAEGCKALADRGVKINVGAHGQREGLGAHWEIWMLVQGGMTPHQALRAATLNGAEYIGMGRHLGSLEAGKLADLAVLETNPLDDVRNSESVSHVMVNGRLYDARTMDEIGNHPKKRGRFFWEE
ncbi:MAG: amidohydrolase [Acidobacteria bacterium]|nr:MAG: amidohydrolase [Acidobacteriota bacterium]